MILIGIIITGVIMSAFLFASFCLGYYYANSVKKEDGLTVTEQNKEFIKQMQEWRNFDGR